MSSARSIAALGCMVVALIVATCGCHMHFLGRYDCRPGAVQERRGGELVEELFKEAVRERTENDSNGTSEN